MIDLHCHSIYSDGALTPEELIQKAQLNELRCLSLTDHDTVAGYTDLLKAAANTNIHIINGIELSVRWKKYDIHILGYQINHTPQLQAMLEQQNTNRIERAQQIGAALAAIGVEDAYNKARKIAGHQRVARPHFARVLVNEGKSRDMQAAFKQYLVRGRSAYIPTDWISIQQAVEGIVQSGGIAVIAHPLKYRLTRSKLHELIKEFKEAGGLGIEVVSGEINSIQIREMASISLRFDLLASSGSDFHADGVSRVNLGRQQQLPIDCKPIWEHWNI